MVRSIRRRASFVALRTDGKTVRLGPLRVTVLPLPEDGGQVVSVAFAIGRSVGNAVTRNRLRRRLRALLLEFDKGRALAPGLYLFGAAPSAAALSFDDLRAQLARLVAQARVRFESLEVAR